MPIRRIVEIDEEKCDGCGLCAPACEEGAIRIVNGKARLVSDVYCDGLGACLGECPRGAISMVEREAEPFDGQAALQYVQSLARPLPQTTPAHGCPGVAVQNLRLNVLAGHATDTCQAGLEMRGASQSSGLRNWPVQLHLVPSRAPFLQDAHLLLVADCVPFACADFHRRFLDGRPVLIGCPKLDDGQFYVQKLADVFRVARTRSVTVLHMEVPCCTGLVRIAEMALAAAGVAVPLSTVTVSIRGAILATHV